MKTPEPDESTELIFVRYITTRDGRRLDAWQYGKKAWPIRVRRRKK